MAQKKIDLDALIASDAPPTMVQKMLGRDWHFLTGFNAFAVGSLQGAKPDDVLKVLSATFINLVIEEERDDWAAALTSAALSAEKLMEILKVLLEAAAERPTESPATSSVSPVRKTSARKSTVVSS